MKDKELQRNWLFVAAILCAVIPLVAILVCSSGVLAAHGLAALEWLSLAGLTAMAVHRVKDANVEKSKALPNGAATITSDGIDLGHGTKGDFLVPVQWEIDAPVLTTGELPDADTMKYSIEHDDASDFGGVADLLTDVLVQTGAGAAGDAAATVVVALPADCKRHIRLKAINSGDGDASGKTATLRGMF